MSIMFKVGDRVTFGRPSGQKTEGVVVKVNARSLKIRTEEDRGRTSVGTEWRVSPSLCTLVDGKAPAPEFCPPLTAKDTVPATGTEFTNRGERFVVVGYEPRRHKYPVTGKRVRDGKLFKFPLGCAS